MKTAVRILLTLAVPGLLGCAGTGTSPETPPAKQPTALDLLRQREPATEWDSASMVEADLNEDGAEDYALTGIRGNLLVVGIVHGPLRDASRRWTLEFPWDGTQDALCSRKVRIRFENFAEAGGPARPGINLHDDQCDAFHIFWDPERQAYEWWRL